MFDLTPIIIIFMVVVMPIWLGLHYSTSWRKHRALSVADEAMLSDLHKTAEKIAQRLTVIERILDDELPEWRKSHDEDL